ncbi:hypothetical protein I5Q34_00500 [Streptomyces sp. AV19]|uniref:hypothetical protein n=1 Tax=Streptomyces sp. AV19 TaxID=2793068 RepID=UPI0018FEC06C|nr:hypothetical protein [Streptomyces sp. AV19]MBH1932788.1 hypothetical protein [Streptomyces sp. AV19]MDG4531459.1 hypothetical protein [Streptomyces sp. AV19]
MTQPRLARQNCSIGRVYRNPITGEEAPSITTITGMLNKAALAPWYAREAAEYAVSSWSELSSLPERERIDLIKAAPRRTSEAAATLGSNVHAAVEKLATGQTLNGHGPELDTFLDQFGDFCATWNPEFIAAEATIWNRAHEYAGTLDAIVSIAGRNYLVDYKTGASGVWPDVQLQLEGLAHGEFILHEDGAELPMPHIDALAALHLRPEGWELVQVHRCETAWRAFLGARAALTWHTRQHQAFGKRLHGAADQPTTEGEAA